MQPLSSLQVVLQALVEAQVYTPQVVLAGVTQVPDPEQCEAGVKVEPLQDAPGAQVTVLAAWVQAPDPLQVPVLPQVVLIGQRPCGSARPPVTFPHKPVPEAQAWQVLQLPVEQQTPSTQLPLPHSLRAAQVVPSPFLGTQLPPAQ